MNLSAFRFDVAIPKPIGDESNMRDLSGHKFGRLTVIGLSHKDKHYITYWLCRCDCGQSRVLGYGTLTIGTTKSCGCYSKDSLRKRMTKHGKRWSREYESWRRMIQRCTNKKTPGYKHYGGRGIKVCDKWKKSFINFFNDMGDRPENTSIDRINNDGNYEPDNCRWATASEQSLNRRPRISCLAQNN